MVDNPLFIPRLLRCPNRSFFLFGPRGTQPGYGTYPTDWIYLKPQYQKSFKGYVQWNTFSSKTAYIKEWTESP